MKNSNSQDRIRQIMEYYGINQTEFCKRTGIQKSALSNYLNGTRQPRQDAVSKIADAFGISPSWVMGYDVPMKEIKPIEIIQELEGISEQDRKILDLYHKADPDSQRAIERILKYVELFKEYEGR
jgi:transcriptional regulator with XRE-family HTH domain